MTRLFLLFFILFSFISCRDTTLFEKTSPYETRIAFINKLTETEKENVLNYEYFYNGGGVAVGDINNDGLVDIVFTANQVENKCYLNKGNLKFDDISKKAGIEGRKGSWKTGVTMADVNNDGWLDIYICYSGLNAPDTRKNELFINNHDLTFTEKAKEYGLDDSGYSTQASFFDFDKDGDLDMFLINHNLKNYERKEAFVMRNEVDYNAGDKLFKNENGKFTEITIQAGIKSNPLGFGLGLCISDVNNDSYPDIYVANDYVEDDYLYINQKDGTFKDELRSWIGHTSYSSMGVDMADINNDGLPEIVTLDMLPEMNSRQKLLPMPENWNVYQAQLQNGFWHANMRNMLQVNQGDHFNEIGQLAGISNTDWSWGVLLADFDNDGFKDVFMSNGIAKDFTNLDFIKFSEDVESNTNNLNIRELLSKMPFSNTKNYIFKNSGNLSFENKQDAWGFMNSTIANGCAYADLDNDGDLEIITNNLNEVSSVYKNNSLENNKSHFAKIRLKGNSKNPFGIGAKVTVKNKKSIQTQDFFPTRGFQSCSHGDLIFGLSDDTQNLEIIIKWPDNKIEILKNIEPDKLIVADYKNAKEIKETSEIPQQLLFSELKDSTFLPFHHQMKNINDFDYQIMLPMHYSYTGPRMTVGDINKDGKEDVFITGTPTEEGKIFQQHNSGFKTTSFVATPQTKSSDAVFFDADNDQDLDLYIVNGSYDLVNHTILQDDLWLNDGKGNFTKGILPEENTNSSCVKAFDIDKDGDVDLFIGGHITPFSFPNPAETFWLKNNGKGIFEKISLGRIGLISDASIVDIDQDGWQDLLVVGEWMPVTILKNEKGKLVKNPSLEMQDLRGWWHCIEAVDLDADGDLDFIVGNHGQNSQIKADKEKPASLIYDDFDQNGTTDFFMNYYIQGKSYPSCSRDELGEQIPVLRKKFTTYQSFSNATMDDMFSSNELLKAKKLIINELNTLALENDHGRLKPHVLPLNAQFAPVYCVSVTDYNKDGKPDLLLAGNNSKFRARLGGKIDANDGVLLQNMGNFIFKFVPNNQHGLYLKGDVRNIKHIQNYWLIGINNERIKVFKQNY